MNPTTLSSLWAARQLADQIGVPYGFFIREGMEFLGARNWRHLPRPNQLLSAEVTDAALAAWNEHHGPVNYYSRITQYRSENYRGHPAQDAHHEWLLAKIRRSWGAPHTIAHFCRQEALLPVSVALREFGEDKVKAAEVETIYSHPEPVAKLGEHEPRYGCFGIQHVHRPEERICAECPHLEACSNATSLAKQTMLREVGSDDPVGDRKKELARLRQQKRRAKLRKKAVPLAS